MKQFFFSRKGSGGSISHRLGLGYCTGSITLVIRVDDQTEFFTLIKVLEYK